MLHMRLLKCLNHKCITFATESNCHKHSNWLLKLLGCQKYHKLLSPAFLPFNNGEITDIKTDYLGDIVTTIIQSENIVNT